MRFLTPGDPTAPAVEITAPDVLAKLGPGHRFGYLFRNTERKETRTGFFQVLYPCFFSSAFPKTARVSGIPITVTRTYDSRQAILGEGGKGDFGIGENCDHDLAMKQEIMRSHYLSVQIVIKSL